ncbi:MAG: class I SAM-dependent methyltransferase [Rhodospirillales bacterium]|nr:MAG: class I SAM-dependent methyltransferase [Rhodospirillales bacterium]
MSSLRGWRRHVSLGIPTVLGIARRGFFIPCRYAADVPRRAERGSYDAFSTILERHRDTFGAWLDAIERYADALESLRDLPPPAPRWTQSWFPRLDAAVAYAITRELAPRRIVEVGCGHSTRFFARAVADADLATRIVAIDPAPRASLERLDHVELHRMTVQAAGDAAFRDLQAGDILAIDSSHVLMPGTDVDLLLNRVLVSLPAGVMVHFHDIFLPDDYPEEWEWRGYNEQLAVAQLVAGGAWSVEFASHFVATRMTRRVEAGVMGRVPLVPGAKETSLWLKKG